MRPFIIGVLLVAVAAVAISVHQATTSPMESVAGAVPVPTVIAGARTMLLPDGKVEVIDALARRIFHWDGARWVEQETGTSR